MQRVGKQSNGVSLSATDDLVIFHVISLQAEFRFTPMHSSNPIREVPWL